MPRSINLDSPLYKNQDNHAPVDQPRQFRLCTKNKTTMLLHINQDTINQGNHPFIN